MERKQIELRLTRGSQYRLLFIAISIFLVLSMDAKAQPSKISDQLVGTWVEYREGATGDTLLISIDEIVWKRTDSFNKGEETFKSGQYRLGNGGRIVKFSSRKVYAREVFTGRKYSGPIEVTISRKGDDIILKIGEMKVEEAPGVLVTQPAETRIYKKIK